MHFTFFACFGGGNVVWYSLKDYVVIDNVYNRTRKAVKIPGGNDSVDPVDGKSAASKSLVVLQPHASDRLYVPSRSTAHSNDLVDT